jgi:hypothetical protein
MPAGHEITIKYRDLNTGPLASLFKDTTNAYKFYWFLAIIDAVAKRDERRIRTKDLAWTMVEQVWYPLNYFKLSFGKQDQFKAKADLMTPFVDASSKTSIYEQVKSQMEYASFQQVESEVFTLTRYVPFRFLRPFLPELRGTKSDQEVNKLIHKQAATYEPGQIPYHFDGDCIIIHDAWMDYIRGNLGLLRDFCYWHLAQFVQKHNPHVPGILQKLQKPEHRSMELNRAGWTQFIRLSGLVQCIYSGQPVTEPFSLDHFLPWSFVTHDLNWNVVPIPTAVNSSKGANLPHLKNYLPALIELQWRFVQKLPAFQPAGTKLMEHYVMLFNTSPSEILSLPRNIFTIKLTETIQPQEQIARGMSFGVDWEFK